MSLLLNETSKQPFIIYTIKMTDVNELELPAIDPELESEAQAIANYEDELAEFVNLYRKDR